jgi:hypothetical protein
LVLMKANQQLRLNYLKLKSMLVSNCCGASAKGGEDYEICSECLEHCEYIETETETETESHSEQMIDIMNKEPHEN